jgi:RNA polymerase sigma factor (TIGR02999 family)
MSSEHPAPDDHAAPSAEATLLMQAAAGGDRAAAAQLLPLVYDQLRKAAQISMASERAGHTLSATALVHEAYVKLVGGVGGGEREVPWTGRAHFYAAAAEAMRQILLDHAKARLRLKRGGGAQRLSIDDVSDVVQLAQREPEEIVTFEELVRRLEEESPDGAAVVRLRFFAGLSVEQTAQALGLSTSTVDRRWAFARAWLFQRLEQARQRERS